MKKYFITGSGDAIEYGDLVKVTFKKELVDGSVIMSKNLVFTEESACWLIEAGFVEEHEVNMEEDSDNLLDFPDETPCEALAELIEDFETLEEKVDKLEILYKEHISRTNKTLDTLKMVVSDVISGEKKEKKTQSKKK